MKADLMVRIVTAATMVGGRYGLIRDAIIVIEGERIAWVGPAQELPAGLAPRADVNGHGRLVTPGLIDCHTHIVYGGNRANEFEQRLQGVSYETIARQGGGIMATVRATRASSAAALAASARPRILALLREGVTTLEIKTGYGLDLESELKLLDAIDLLAGELPLDVVRTFLGAHTLPPEYRDRPDAYVDLVCETMIPAVAGRVDAVDVFCESIAFSLEQTRRIFEAARAHALAVKVHAEQLSDQGGAALAASMGALSADHLEHLAPDAVATMAASGTVAVLLPCALYTLRETRRPPVDLLRAHGVPMAVATDANPGTSPCFSILLAMNMACVLLALTPEEALAGVTIYAARALGREASVGTLEVGKQADLVLWDVETPAELVYGTGYNPGATVIRRGDLRDGAQIA